jgi:pimeloyl-ACP methyl ester carboxylesterase
MRFRTSNKKTFKRFHEEGIAIQIDTVLFNSKNIRCVSRKEQTNTSLVLFIHGAPGSGDAFYDYLSDSVLASHADLMTMDRLGYGYSDFGNPELSIEQQALSIRAILQTQQYEKIILVGHSYGGPIALRYAIDFPNEVNAVLLIAPAVDPENEKIMTIAHLGRYRSTRWLAPATLRVATDEKFSHVRELQKLDSLDFERITVPIVHIHGKKDALVPFKNMAYAESKVPSSLFKKVVLENETHFIPWTQHQLVTKEILELLEP